MIALLDTDVIAYRIGWACKNESAAHAYRSVDSFVADCLLYVDSEDRYHDEWRLYLTGSNNFRHEVAKSHKYKGNRPPEKPPLHKEIRQYLVDQWGAVVYDGIEADDAIATDATTLGDNCTICSVDKDFKQVPGYHYNFVKREHFRVSEDEGLRFLYQQILTGDTADNIIGLHGVGEVKAKKLLGDSTNESELYDICLEAYKGDEARMVENARLLFLRRHEGQIWMAPKWRDNHHQNPTTVDNGQQQDSTASSKVSSEQVQDDGVQSSQRSRKRKSVEA